MREPDIDVGWVFTHVQGVHLPKAKSSSPLIFVMPISRLHINIDQLKNEAIPRIHVNSNIGVVILSFYIYAI
jgi:hypothetical protein